MTKDMVFFLYLTLHWLLLGTTGWLMNPPTLSLQRSISFHHPLRSTRTDRTVASRDATNSVRQRMAINGDDDSAAALLSSSLSKKNDDFVYRPVFDFTNSSTIEQMDRLDDAIMGGISTSAIRSIHGEAFARWSGICRTDGGGFCGFRTNPFLSQNPLIVGYADGFYVTCRLTSDNEPTRRVWKMTTRSKPDRGELLYQALFPLTTSSSSQNDDDWTTVHVPFASFRYVRGPRMIPDGPPLNTTGGLYQIGMTMSKFAFAEQTTEIDNFRDGYFELQIQEIGLYKKDDRKVYGGVIQAMAQPTVYNKSQARQKRPIAVKVLSPVFKLFFSEQSQRRKSAMRLLRDERKLSRARAILWGLKSRAAAVGWIRSLWRAAGILAVDSFRAVLFTAAKITLIYPLRLLGKLVNVLSGSKAVRSAE